MTQLDGLLQGNRHVNGGLYFLNRGFVVLVHERGNVKGFTGMVEYVVRDGTRGLSKNITENIVKFQVGDGQAVLCTVFCR